MKAKVIRTIQLLQNNGYTLRDPHSKPLGDGIFDLRVKQSSNISRVLYVVDNKAVLTHVFIKKTMKTPKREIEKAISYRSDYLQREQEG